jgi:hypothetical protein
MEEPRFSHDTVNYRTFFFLAPTPVRVGRAISLINPNSRSSLSRLIILPLESSFLLSYSSHLFRLLLLSLSASIVISLFYEAQPISYQLKISSLLELYTCVCVCARACVYTGMYIHTWPRDTYTFDPKCKQPKDIE